MTIDSEALDGVFEVKLDEKQKGYLWAKLSPKSKTALTNLIAQEANKARLDELRLILAAREPGYMYKRIITDRIAQLTAEKGSNNG